MIYLASPYTHPDQQVQTRRYLIAREFTYYHLNKGVPLLSPIVYGHQFHRDFGVPPNADFWAFLNDEMLKRCVGVWVLMIDGWKDSYGVTAEIARAEHTGIPIEYKEPLDAYF
jgi:hypothetical protein